MNAAMPFVRLVLTAVLSVCAAACSPRPGATLGQLNPTAVTKAPGASADNISSVAAASAGSDTVVRPAGSGSALGPQAMQFLVAAVQCDIFEIQAGRLADRKADNPSVRAFADMMVQIHSRVNDNLAQLALSKNVALPSAPDQDGRQMLARLRGLSGWEFDRTYSQEMLKAHRRALGTFQDAAYASIDGDLRSFARAQLPALRDDLRIARTLPGADES